MFKWDFETSEWENVRYDNKYLLLFLLDDAHTHSGVTIAHPLSYIHSDITGDYSYGAHMQIHSFRHKNPIKSSFLPYTQGPA